MQEDGRSRTGLDQDLMHQLLAIARAELGMDLAFVSEFVDGRQVVREVEGDEEAFGLSPGAAAPYEQTYCARVLDGRLPAAIPDARANPVTVTLPTTDLVGIGSYVGAPIRSPEGEVVGMLCCLGRGPRESLDDGALPILASIAGVLARDRASALARSRRDDATRRDVRGAIASGMRMVFQPIVDLHDLRVVGVEALARFPGSSARVDAWFANAAAVGLGIHLERAAVARALAELQRLPSGIGLSLNASPSFVLDGGVEAVLDGAPAARLTLELTEHDSVPDYELLEARLAPLRAAGMRLAVDDAGSGYASFRHVLRLRPDVIKLDIELTRGIDADPARLSLARGLRGLAEELDAVVVAEGIETRAEFETLREAGITLGQGYFLARPGPLPVPDVAAVPGAARRAQEPAQR